MPYVAPVLAERAHIADRAQRASVRRKGGEGSSRVLGDAVAAALRADNVDPTTVSWDAWRREDGRWTLVADLPGTGASRRAEFVFDAPGHYVLADNDEARVLADELAGYPVPIVAVLGNHDHESGHGAEVTSILRDRGVHVLEGDIFELNERVGIAGAKGFMGGFGRRCLTAFGEMES